MAKSPRSADVSADREDKSTHMQIQTGGNSDRIAQRAYERYEARGREDGRDQEDWFEAEREIQQGPSESTTTSGAGSGDDDGNQAA